MKGVIETLIEAREAVLDSYNSPNSPVEIKVKFNYLKPSDYVNHKDEYYFHVYKSNYSPMCEICLFRYGSIVGFVEIQKNKKAVVVTDYFFGKKMTKTLPSTSMELISSTQCDAFVPQAFENKNEDSVEELANLPF
jgi:hypothetical protein